MNKQDIVDSISYCGLVCKLCHLADECDGCKATASKCGNHSEKWDGCYHRNCCLRKNIGGCWECQDSPCDKDMFSPTHDVRIRAFVRCLREEGPEALAEYLVRNEARGIRYGYQKDYDGKETEEEVLVLLRTGENAKR